MSTASESESSRLVYTAQELLASGDYAEPLIANEVRCHGGFLEDGTYRSPRSRSDGAFVFNHGETDMGDKGSKDKGKREQQKKAKLTQKEKRKLKREKKKK